MSPYLLKDSCIQTDRYKTNKQTCARGVMIIVKGNRHGDRSSNTGQVYFHFAEH